MKLGHSVKVFKTIGMILTLGSSLSVNAGLFGLGGTYWKEEVLLHDGQKIIVQRFLDRGGRHEIGQRGSATNQTLTFLIPGTRQKIVWEDKRSEDLGGSSFSPMLLDIVNDTAYVLVLPAGCLSYNKWGRPNPPYVVFKYSDHDKGKEWNRIPLEELPAEIRTPNLILSSPDDEAKKAAQPIVSAEAIQALYARYRIPEHKTILREALPNAGKGCGEMVYDGNGGWIGKGFFRKQPSYEACLKYCEQENMSAQYCPCDSIFKGSK
jgi:hypothetical protein